MKNCRNIEEALDAASEFYDNLLLDLEESNAERQELLDLVEELKEEVVGLEDERDSAYITIQGLEKEIEEWRNQ